MSRRALFNVLVLPGHFDQSRNENSRRVNVIGVDCARRNQMLDLGDRHLAGGRHDRIEVPRRLAIDEVAIVIACTDYLQAALAGPFIARLRQTAPGIRIALRGLDIDEIEEQMVKGEVDLALMTPSAAPANLRSRHLFDERYVLIGRRSHPRLNHTLSVADYAALEHVIVSLRGSEFATPVDTTLKALGHSRNVMVSASSFLFVLDIVATTDFVALVPEKLVVSRTDALTVVEPPFPVEGFAVGMVWHERTHDYVGQRWIRRQIAQRTG